MKKDKTHGKITDQEANDLRAGWQRCQADFENYKKRTEGEKKNWGDRGKIEVLEELLPILDNIRLAVSHAPQNSDAQSWIGGIAHIASQIDQAFVDMGVERIEPQPKGKFDPQLHESVAHEAVVGFPIGSISRVEKPGYKVGETVVRPARVYLCENAK